MRRFCAVLALSAAALALAGCGGLREAAGMTKKAPDEFAVTTKAPLVIPPDFNLRPPMPGAAPTNQSDPSANAQDALFNNSDPQTVAAGMRGNYTPGEKLLLANAGVQNADPGVRVKLQNDARATQAADRSFTDKVLGASASPNTGEPVNPDLELGKHARAKAAPKPKDDGGWFDWL